MTTIAFLIEWAVRSAILILSGALLLQLLRVKDASIRLAAWTAILCGSLAIPVMTSALPGMPLRIIPHPTEPVMLSVIIPDAASATSDAVPAPPSEPSPFDWARALSIVYLVVAVGLLLRLAVGLVMSLRLLRNSHATETAEIRESDRVVAPVTLGILHPVIVLPVGFRCWDAAKLRAVLAHERSHIRRFDPAVQFLSAIHRALLWFTPLSWFLHSQIVRVAEEASDDAAVAITRDRAGYAEILLEFVRLGVGARATNWLGVPMARYAPADRRIHRILDSTAFSRGITGRRVAAILMLGSPLAYVIATAQPQSAPPAQTMSVQSSAAPIQQPTAPVTRGSAPNAPRNTLASGSPYLAALGNVAASTITVRSLVDGELMSVNFKEGEQVQAGQLIATIDPRPFQLQLDRAQGLVASDRRQFDLAHERELGGEQGPGVAQAIEYTLKVDQAKLQDAQLQIDNTQIKAPITGMAGLGLVEPGNIVHTSDAAGIVTIAQLQPISVLFTLPEGYIPQVRGRLGTGGAPAVEIWSRDNKLKVAVGRLIAMDNQIDDTTGTVKLKAAFDNKDGALFPNQFVNVRLLMGAQN